MFLPHFSTVCNEAERSPDQWILVMHGIYGRGGNWRTVARRLTALRPSWGVMLVDLRMHGKSMDATAPHTLASCAGDVLALMDQQEEQGRHVRMIAGHSFGGKVALAMRAARPKLCPLWLIDSSPSAQPGAMQDESNTVVSVLRMLEVLPKTFADRNDFVDEVKARGYPTGLAQWLAMNLEAQADGYHNTLDPSALSDLLNDYFSKDLWSVVESARKPIFVAIASRGSSITPADRERFLANPAVHAHEIDGGHWLHVDALEPLVAQISASLI